MEFVIHKVHLFIKNAKKILYNLSKQYLLQLDSSVFIQFCLKGRAIGQYDDVPRITETLEFDVRL